MTVRSSTPLQKLHRQGAGSLLCSPFPISVFLFPGEKLFCPAACLQPGGQVRTRGATTPMKEAQVL